MTTLAITTALACLGIGACGYLIGRLHSRTADRRPGYVTIQPTASPEWNFPAAPRLYDQERDHREQPTLRASLSHPLVPDPRGYDDGGEFSRRVDLEAAVIGLDWTCKALER